MKTRMPTVAAVAVALALVAASAARSAIPTSHYWTTARAASVVKATVKVACAKLQPNPNHLPPAASCATQPPSSIAGATVACIGRGVPLNGTRRFHAFRCTWDSVNHVSFGSLMVYVSGPSAIRWKVL